MFSVRANFYKILHFVIIKQNSLFFYRELSYNTVKYVKFTNIFITIKYIFEKNEMFACQKTLFKKEISKRY